MANKVQFETFGCKINTYETEVMKNLISNSKLSNAIVVNTCAVTSEAVRKAKQSVRKLKKNNPGAKIIVTGCAAQIEPQIFAGMTEVDFVVGNAEKMMEPTWKKVCASSKDLIGQTEKILVNDIMSAKETSGHLINGFGTRSRAYVQIQNGCDHRCTFCVIPFGRGNSKSVPAGVVVEQIKKLVRNNYKEIVLTGIDITAWGKDLPTEQKLGDLITMILDLVTGLERLRISSLDSIEVDEKLFDCITTSNIIMPHLHLSLQSGDNLILKRMKRRHNRYNSIEFCQKIKKLRPQVVFGADLIAGFPTETDTMFQNTIALVKECELTWLHVFPFSIRNGTPAARMPQVDSQLIKKRASILRELGNVQVRKHLKNFEKNTCKVLIEKPRLGRAEDFTEVLFETDQPIGQLITTKILGCNNKQLNGAPL